MGLEYIHFKQENSLAVALWFVILTTWFLWKLETQMTENDRKLKEAMRLSSIRYCFETLQKTIIQAAEIQLKSQYYWLDTVYEKV